MSFEYFVMCVLFGILFLWAFGWWAYIAIFLVGLFMGPIGGYKSMDTYTKILIFYPILTPIFFTLLAGLEPLFGISQSTFDTSSVPGTSTIALIHAFIMWDILAFIFGGFIRGKVKYRDIN